MSRREDHLKQIREWGYCYCTNCGKIAYSFDLEATDQGIRCVRCNSYDLEAPDWVCCPHHKSTAVNCPRGGKGIVVGQYETACVFHCNFR